MPAQDEKLLALSFDLLFPVQQEHRRRRRGPARTAVRRSLVCHFNDSLLIPGTRFPWSWSQRTSDQLKLSRPDMNCSPWQFAFIIHTRVSHRNRHGQLLPVRRILCRPGMYIFNFLLLTLSFSPLINILACIERNSETDTFVYT
jgi:hypothetical protein